MSSTRLALMSIAAASLPALTTGAVEAADLGGGRPAPAYSPPPFVGNTNIERWTGLYFGASLGYGFGTTGVDGTAGAFSFDQSGAVGSLFAGYNWQIGRAVIGVEGDIGTGNVNGSAIGNQGSIEADLNVLGSLRARAGLLVTPSLLVYATGGFAWADINYKYQGATDVSKTFTGYQVGAGSELMLSSNWTMRLEYIFTDLGSDTASVGAISNKFDPDFHTVRAGLSFKF